VDRISAWAERRAAPVVATIAIVVLFMAYSLLGHNVVGGGRFKLYAPSDLWSLAGSSWALAHGHFTQIYSPKGALTSPPAFEVILAPILLVGQLFGLSPHVQAGGPAECTWFVLGPVAVLIGSTALFAIDAVARSWHFSDRQRLALGLLGGLGVVTVAGLWGHPEDCVAFAAVLWAALQMERRGLAAAPRAALLLGIGIAFQPLAILGVVPVLARVDWRDIPRLVWRLALPPLLVLVPPLLAEPSRTLFVLVKQPYLPQAISFTPLTHLAPVIGPGVDGGGPTRLVATVLSAVLALVVCRRRQDLVTVLSMTAVAYCLRILLETELNWYYLWPVPALCLLLSLRRSTMRFVICSAALVASIVLGDHSEVHHITRWWPALMATLVVMLLTAVPPPHRVLELVRSGRAPWHARTVECEVMVSWGGSLRE
jgi:hypothetical protein